jgi:hypothetical protein
MYARTLRSRAQWCAAMKKPVRSQLPKSAARLLMSLAGGAGTGRSFNQKDICRLTAADLAVQDAHGNVTITEPGRAHLARSAVLRSGVQVDPYLGQHLALARRHLAAAESRSTVTVNEAESPLAWLARRKGRDGRPLIQPVQLQAGDRLRGDFTRAQLMPRTTSNWSAAVALDRRSANPAATFTETVIAARQRVRGAVEAVGPEFAGLLLDLCCFLKGLEDIERERGWPPGPPKSCCNSASTAWPGIMDC